MLQFNGVMHVVCLKLIKKTAQATAKLAAALKIDQCSFKAVEFASRLKAFCESDDTTPGDAVVTGFDSDRFARFGEQFGHIVKFVTTGHLGDGLLHEYDGRPKVRCNCVVSVALNLISVSLQSAKGKKKKVGPSGEADDDEHENENGETTEHRRRKPVKLAEVPVTKPRLLDNNAVTNEVDETVHVDA